MTAHSALGAWRIRASDFPHDQSDREQLRFCLRYAVLAPSTHNSQPWRFELEDDTVLLRADRTRSLPVVDPSGRELAISCGAALLNLRIAIEHFGRQPVVELLPDGSGEDGLARIGLGEPRASRAGTWLLFNAIPERRTNRRAFESWGVPAEVVRELERCAAQEDCWLEPVQGEEKEALADLTADADRLQHHDVAFRHELEDWVATGPRDRRDGIPDQNLGWHPGGSVFGPLLVRTFQWSGRGFAAKGRQLAAGSPLLAVLGTREDDLASWLAVGQALERVLLGACVAGLESSFLNQAVEVPSLRRRLKSLLVQDGFPQLVLRLGYGPRAPATPRRDLEEVLVPEGPGSNGKL